MTYRIGGTPDDLGSRVFIDPDEVQPVMVRGPAYLQYRLEFETSDATVAPVVDAVAFEWVSQLPSRPGSSGRVNP